MQARVVTTPVTFVGDFVSGVGLLVRGARMYARDPGLLLLGVVPAFITGVLFLGGFGVLVYVVGDLATLLTPFADGWADWLRVTVRVVAVLALLGLGGLVAVLTFTAVTLAVGDPFYEKISARVEERCGGVAGAVELPWTTSWKFGVVDSARLVVRSVLLGVPLFVGGFVPVVGQTVVPVVGAALGGWTLAQELAAGAFERRGLLPADRRAALHAIRPVTLGFGVAVFVAFLVPLGAVLLTPAAVAGATLLARRALGEPATPS